MLWTVAIIADSAQFFYELLVRRLSDRERDELWREYIGFAELFGMPAESAPQTYAEFRDYWNAKLESDELFLTEESRYIGYATAFEIPMPRLHQPGKRVHDAVMLGSLPRRIRELYRLPYGAAEKAAFNAAATAMRTARRLTPGPLARGSNTKSFEMVANTERSRIENGRNTPQIRDDGPVGIRLPA